MRWRVRRSVVSGDARVPGDKSIAHRALLCAALADGRSTVEYLPDGEDVQSTARCLQAMGTRIRWEHSHAMIESSGTLEGPLCPLDCGNSGTSMRLLAGVLAGQPFRSCLTGDDSLSRRPMRRVVEPLERMGATVHSTDGHAPLELEGGALHGIDFTLPVPSAQVKSAVLLAGLFADGDTTVREPVEFGRSRDHTEVMLRALAVDIRAGESEENALTSTVTGGQRPCAFETSIPGDPSSAAFLFAAATLTGGEVTVSDLLVNPTRTGFVSALQAMGAHAELQRQQFHLGEPAADVTVGGRVSEPLALSRSAIPGTIDEVPLLVLLATQLPGTTTIVGVGELRVKETDRIQAAAGTLNALGANVEELSDGFVVHGPTPLHGAVVHACGDHRIGMMLAVAGLIADGVTVIDGAEAGAISWPGFAETLRSLGGAIDVL